MTNQNKQSKFGLGLIFGTILGALAGIFLAPKSGEENREEVVKKMRELKKRIDEMEIDKALINAKKELVKKLEELEEKWEEFDKEKYIKLVEEVVNNLKEETRESAEKLLKLKESLIKGWEEIFTKEKKAAKKSS